MAKKVVLKNDYTGDLYRIENYFTPKTEQLIRTLWNKDFYEITIYVVGTPIVLQSQPWLPVDYFLLKVREFLECLEHLEEEK